MRWDNQPGPVIGDPGASSALTPAQRVDSKRRTGWVLLVFGGVLVLLSLVTFVLGRRWAT